MARSLEMRHRPRVLLGCLLRLCFVGTEASDGLILLRFGLRSGCLSLAFQSEGFPAEFFVALLLFYAGLLCEFLLVDLLAPGETLRQLHVIFGLFGSDYRFIANRVAHQSSCLGCRRGVQLLACYRKLVSKVAREVDLSIRKK